MPSQELGDSVARGYAFLDIGFYVKEGSCGCDIHHFVASSLLKRVVTNIFFSNQRKRSTDNLTKDNAILLYI